MQICAAIAAPVILAVSLTVIAFLYIGGIRLDHEARVQSHQYQTSKEAQAATLEANLAEIRIQLANPEISEATKNNLRSQEAALRVQINATNKTRSH